MWGCVTLPAGLHPLPEAEPASQLHICRRKADCQLPSKGQKKAQRVSEADPVSVGVACLECSKRLLTLLFYAYPSDQCHNTRLFSLAGDSLRLTLDAVCSPSPLLHLSWRGFTHLGFLNCISCLTPRFVLGLCCISSEKANGGRGKGNSFVRSIGGFFCEDVLHTGNPHINSLKTALLS